LTDTDKQNSTGKYKQTNSIQIRKSKQPKIQQNKTTLVQLPLTTLGQETGGLILQRPRAHTADHEHTVDKWSLTKLKLNLLHEVDDVSTATAALLK